jgi:hypothetical protein
MSKLPIKRALINGKRRFVVYLFDLVDHLEELTDYDKSCRDKLVETLKDMIKEGKFRDNIDWTYNAKRHEIALTLSSTQILLARYADLMSQKATATQSNTEQPTTAQSNDLNKIVWDVIHQITDFIQGIKS